VYTSTEKKMGAEPDGGQRVSGEGNFLDSTVRGQISCKGRVAGSPVLQGLVKKW
jgi:hypothetical protein